MNPGFCLGSILDHGGWILQFTQTKVSSHFTAKRPKTMVFCYLMIFMFFLDTWKVGMNMLGDDLAEALKQGLAECPLNRGVASIIFHRVQHPILISGKAVWKPWP